jgi:hypothetical protein
MNIEFEGPASFLPVGEGRSIFEQPDAAMPGVYLWTVPDDTCFRVNYVGISESSIVQRMAEHFRSYFKGAYTIYDSAFFGKFAKTPVYGGNANPAEFRRRFGEIAPHLIAMLGSYRLFYAVLPMDKRSLERIESTLILRLQKSDRAKAFLDNARPSRTDGVPMDIRLAWPRDCEVAGLGEER